jgi:carboxymethylenebutenolidase
MTTTPPTTPPSRPSTPLTVHAPSGDRKGGVVVVQEAFGVNHHIDAVTRRVAEAGWLAVAPHLFHRTGDPELPYGDFSEVRLHMAALTVEGVMEDMDAALTALADAGIAGEHVGVVGFCMGGTVALATAARRDLGAAVSFYGGGVTASRFGFDPLVEEATRLRCPWLGLYGDRDTGIPVDDVEQLRAAAASSGQATEIVRYPDAGHGFHCDERPDYHEASAHDAWRRTLAWFDSHLV